MKLTRILLFAASLAVFGLPTTPATAGAPYSAWQVESTVENRTDFEAKYAFSYSRNEQFVFIVCGSGGIKAWVRLAFVDLQPGGRQLTYRIDTGPVVKVAGSQAKGEEGGILLLGQDALDLARALAKGQSEALFTHEAGDGEFTLEGSSKAVSDVLTHCGHTPEPGDGSASYTKGHRQ